MISSENCVIEEWVTIVFCSHNKPIQCKEIIDSIIQQTFPNWKCVICDSGILYDQGYFDKIDDPRIQIIRSDETPEMQEKYNMASWHFNRCKVNSEWIMFLCDDDLLYKDALQGFYTYSVNNPEAQAMYGHAFFTGPFPHMYNYAQLMRGKCVNGAMLDCKIDGGQTCVKTSLLEKHKWNEDKSAQGHADGLWLESIGAEVPFEPVDVMVLHNRKIPGLSLGIKNYEGIL